MNLLSMITSGISKVNESKDLIDSLSLVLNGYKKHKIKLFWKR